MQRPSICLALCLALAGLTLASPSASAEEFSPDKTFRAAVATRDTRLLGAMLSGDFSWITADGDVNDKWTTLRALDALAAALKDETDVQIHHYGRSIDGRLASVRGVHDGMRFLRIFAHRQKGWQAFAMIDTAVVAPAGPASVEAQAGQGDCENPCRTVPYTPKTAMDEAILATWQKTKMVEWKPDAKAWASFIADEFMIINKTTVRTKAEREEIARRQEASGVGTPGDPIVSMRIVDFSDDAAVMFSEHTPVRGGKPYRNIRVWVQRDGRWQLAISQQSDIKSAPAVAAVGAKP